VFENIWGAALCFMEDDVKGAKEIILYKVLVLWSWKPISSFCGS
jgi:hypothetical protein